MLMTVFYFYLTSCPLIGPMTNFTVAALRLLIFFFSFTKKKKTFFFALTSSSKILFTTPFHTKAATQKLKPIGDGDELKIYEI